MLAELVWMIGNTYSTIGRDHKFTVESIDDGGIEIVVHKNGNSRRIVKKEIDQAWNLLLQHGILEQKELAQSSQNSAYVIKFLSSFAGVKIKRKPVALIYQKN
jgi:hypothetical protein